MAAVFLNCRRVQLVGSILSDFSQKFVLRCQLYMPENVHRQTAVKWYWLGNELDLIVCFLFLGYFLQTVWLLLGALPLVYSRVPFLSPIHPSVLSLMYSYHKHFLTLGVSLCLTEFLNHSLHLFNWHITHLLFLLTLASAWHMEDLMYQDVFTGWCNELGSLTENAS